MYDKKCLIVLYHNKEAIQIIDFFTNETIYRCKIKQYVIYSYYKINCMVLLNYKIYIINSDEYDAADIVEINLITDEQKIATPMYNNKYYDGIHLIQPYKLQKIRLKNFGECILALPKWKTERHEAIRLFYFKEKVNKNTQEEIKKKDELEKKLNSLESYKNLYKRNKGFESDKDLLKRIKKFEDNFKIISKNIELQNINILIYKRHKEEFKNKEKIIQEIFKDIENCKHEFALIEKKKRIYLK